MPSLATRQPAPQPVPDQLSRLPPRLPQLPEEVFERFPSLRTWQESEDRWWSTVFQALQVSQSEVSQHATATDTADDVLGVEITEEREERETADGFLSGKYTLQVIAGDVVTGMEITSSTGPNAGTVSDVTFQADRFQIYSGTTKKVMFVADAIQNKIRLADVLTVDSSAGTVYIKTTAGGGAYNSAGTPFFVDNAGRMSLGTGLTFDGSNLTISGTITATAGAIGGWNISATTLSKNNAILDSAGQLVLGTSNDVVYLSATDGTYRIWIGNATAASASFSVTKAGAIFAISGTVGGLSLSSTTLSSGANATFIELSSLGTAGLQVGSGTNDRAFVRASSSVETGLFVANSSGNTIASLVIDSTSHATRLVVGGGAGASTEGVRVLGISSAIEFGQIGSGDTNLYRSAANTLKTDDSLVVENDLTVNTSANIVGFAFSSGALDNVAGAGLHWSTTTGRSQIDLGSTSGVRLSLRRTAPTATLAIIMVDGSGNVLARMDGTPGSGGKLSLNDSGGNAVVVFDSSVAGGAPQFGVRTAIGAETLTGYITITDSGGTTRKLGVVS